MMNVSSAIEIYTTVLGWFMYDGIWGVLADAGLVYIPIVAAILNNWITGWRMQGIEGAEAVIRNNWMDVLGMMTVIALAGIPVFNVSSAAINHTAACGGPTFAGRSTGTLYDRAFAALDGRSAQVPIWWDTIMHVADGLNNAVVALVPCSPDLRTYAYRLDNVRINEPGLRRQLELFTRDCWLKARAKFMANHTKLPANYPPQDIDWIGSRYFLDTDGFYGNANLNLSMRASEEIPGFQYNAARDTEYQAGFIPTYGRPECKDWWEDSLNGLQPQLLALVDPEAITQTNIDLSGDVQGAYSAVIRRIVEPERAAFGRLIDIDNYTSPFGNNSSGVSQGVAGVGLTFELASWWPKVYALRQAAPIGQSFILMGVYMFLPFILLFSGYSFLALYTTTAAIIAIKFLTPIWTLAVWIDNHMMEALGIKWYSWMNLQEDKAATLLILNLVAILLFVVLPVVWFMVIGWAGLSIHKTMDTFKGLSDPIDNGPDRVSNEVTKKILRR
ncbi:MAG: conjugal transfer protein TraG N-terminal domain-containing protein [Methyloglobulus sp.]|nr:hypothetical protein [Methyloglobulus sp.]